MHAFLSICLGYLMGCMSPAALVGRKKNINLRREGTKNLGATNTALVMGQKAGWFVLIFDMFKSWISYKVARLLFPHLAVAGVLAGFGVILGHCFPVFMGFRGGKGLAAFGGLVLAHDPVQFVVLLSLGIVLALLLNYGVYLAVSASLLFPFFSYFRSGSLPVFLTTALVGGLVFGMHTGNLRRAITGEDPIHTRDGLKRIFGRKQK